MTEHTVHDRVCMARALRLAEKGRYTTPPNPRVGCVIVKGSEVVGEGWHRRTGEAHAEIEALGRAGDRAHGATAYVTLEPCAHTGRTGPCTEELIRAGIARVIYAAADPNPAVAGNGAERLRAAGVATSGGLLAAQSERLNRGFFMRMRDGRPQVVLKTASSLDGATAMADGESRWITGGEARRDVQRLRAAAGAILTGVGTVLADDPRLSVRGEEFGKRPRQPLRVVLDSRFRTPPGARIIAGEGASLVIGTVGETAGPLGEAGAETLVVDASKGRPDLAVVLRELAAREVNDVLVEAGPVLGGALLGAGLVDELVIYLAPHIMGAKTLRQFETPSWLRLADRLALEIVDVRALGRDLRVTARPAEQR